MTNIVYRGSCEGLQEQTFLNHVSKLINNNPRCKNKVYFDLINVGGGDPLEVVKKAVNYNFIGKKEFIKNKRVIALFDYDFKDSKFLAALKLANDNKIIPFYTIANNSSPLCIVPFSKGIEACPFSIIASAKAT